MLDLFTLELHLGGLGWVRFWLLFIGVGLNIRLRVFEFDLMYSLSYFLFAVQKFAVLKKQNKKTWCSGVGVDLCRDG